MNLSERTRAQLEASHHNFNASTINKKLDFFDTCFENDDIDESDDVVTPQGSPRKSISIASQQGQMSNDSLYLHESTMDFLIEENVSERYKRRDSPPKKEENHEPDGALEALFASNPHAAPRCRSVSSNGIVNKAQQKGRKSRISKIFTKRKSKGLQDFILEEAEEDMEPTAVAPLIMGAADKLVVKPGTSSTTEQPKPKTSESMSPPGSEHELLFSDRSESKPLSARKEIGKDSQTNVSPTLQKRRSYVRDGPVDETSERTNTTASLTIGSATEDKEDKPSARSRETSPMPGRQRKGIRRKDLYGSRQNSGRRLAEGGGGGGEDDRRGKRHSHQQSHPRRQGSQRKLAAESDGTGNPISTSPTTEEKRAPRKTQRRSRLSQSEHRPEHKRSGSARDVLGHQSDHRDHRGGRRRSSMDHGTSGAVKDHPTRDGSGRISPTNNHSTSTRESARSRTSENRGGRRRPSDSLSQTEHGVGGSRRRSVSRNSRSNTSNPRRSSSVGGGRRTTTRSPESSSRKVESSRGRPSTGRRSDSARHLGAEEGTGESPAPARRTRSSRTHASLSPKPKRSSPRLSSTRKQLSSRDLGTASSSDQQGAGHQDSTGRRDIARRGRRARSSRNLGGSDTKDVSPHRSTNGSAGADNPGEEKNERRQQANSPPRPSSCMDLSSPQEILAARTDAMQRLTPRQCEVILRS